MIKTFITAAFLVLVFSVKAQEFQGKAEYFSKRIIKNKEKKIDDATKKELDPQFQEAIQEAMRKASEKRYLLTFSKTESVYEEQESLEKPAAASSGVSISISFSGAGKKYMNIKDQKTIVEDEVFGKEFLIEEPLIKPDWKLVDETKKIGDYTCFKAELLILVTDKQRKAYEEFLKKEEKKPALFKMKEPKDEVITAWYTPEIPVNFGPNNYWGLPGLILEINENNNITLCSKVVLNTKEKTKIKVPNNGDKVSQKKFDEIQKKKADSMKDEDGNIIFSTMD